MTQNLSKSKKDMNSQELEDTIQDNQEALVSLHERVNDMEKREKDREVGQSSIQFPIKVPDYSAELKEIKQAILEILEASTPAKQAEELAAIVDRVLSKLPEKVKTVVVHRVDTRSKGWIAGVIAVFFLVAVLSGVTFSLWRENGKLQANDVKFRLIRQYYPKAAFWADTAYQHHPEKMTLLAEQREAAEVDSPHREAGGISVRPKGKGSANRKSAHRRKR